MSLSPAENPPNQQHHPYVRKLYAPIFDFTFYFPLAFFLDCIVIPFGSLGMSRITHSLYVNRSPVFCAVCVHVCLKTSDLLITKHNPPPREDTSVALTMDSVSQPQTLLLLVSH